MKSSPLLLETVKIENGEVFNLPYHQKRCNRSRKELFGLEEKLDLSKYITDIPSQGLYRCRIIYGEALHTVEYLPYLPKEINSLRIVPSTIDYHYKYLYRDDFNTLLKKNSDVDEILIEKEGLLTDTTISNIALYDGKTWFTPRIPLLKGTMRAKLIDEGFLKTRDITKKELSNYSQVALINAMIGFKILNHFKIQM
jgi:4-amino-4-deoxychorismate lyase